MGNRVYNFSAGPSMLPESVLEKAAVELLNYENSGMSVMEMSHRSKVYEAIIARTEELLRSVMQIPDTYEVLFLQGGATSQFAMVPLNLMGEHKAADYAVTGQFSGRAAAEAGKYGDVHVVFDGKKDTFTQIPSQSELNFSGKADYFHICLNNTIFGTKWGYIPEVDVPLVADISSCICSEPIDVTKFGMLYAGAQKNMAPAGLTIVIIRKDLMGHAAPMTPVMFDYQVMADNDSMYNTPPTYTIYMCKLVLEWIESLGGLSAMKAMNEEKAQMLYNFLDNSKLFKNPVAKDSRSMMNVTFVTGSDELDAKFVKVAVENGLVNLKGHRSVGGMRASIYNAMPKAGIEKLISVMAAFEKDYL